VLFAQGRDLPGQRPDETKALCRRAGNEVVFPTVRHSGYGCVLPVHALKVSFLPSEINLIVVERQTSGVLAEEGSEAGSCSFIKLAAKFRIDTSSGLSFRA